MQDDPVARRRPRRVKLGGSSSASVSEGMRLMDVDLNDSVQSRSTTDTQPLPQSNDITTKSRLEDIAVGSKSYAKEYRLKMVHRMLMRNVPLDTVAKELGVSIHTAMRDRKELRRRLQEEARNLDINHLIGDTLGFYQELQAMSLKLASSLKAPINMRLAAMRTALASKNDQFRFLNSAGVLDVLRYQAAEKDGKTDIERMVAITEAILSDDEGALTAEDLQGIADMGVEEDEGEIQVL